jgi:transposase
MGKVDTQKALERRRLRGGRMLLRGLSKAEVGRRLDVSVTTVMRWAEKLDEGGLEALKTRRRRGRPATIRFAARSTRSRRSFSGSTARRAGSPSIT